MSNNGIVNIHGKDYLITNDGTVYSKLRAVRMLNGYQYFQLGGRKGKQRYVHSLVMEIYGKKKPVGKNMICHKNDIKTDNRIANLYWGTGKENTQDGMRNNKNPRAYLAWRKGKTI